MIFIKFDIKIHILLSTSWLTLYLTIKPTPPKSYSKFEKLILEFVSKLYANTFKLFN